MNMGVCSTGRAVVLCFETGITPNRLSQAEGSLATNFITDLTDGCSGSREDFPHWDTQTLRHSAITGNLRSRSQPLTKKSNLLV